MPTTSLRRPISRLARTRGLAERSFGQWPLGLTPRGGPSPPAYPTVTRPGAGVEDASPPTGAVFVHTPCTLKGQTVSTFLY
jgi:hypothetical protein